MSDKKAKDIIRRFEQMKRIRDQWESLWQDVKDYVRPVTNDFNYQSVRGERQTDKIFDSTAPWSLEQLAAGLNSYLTSPTSRWFNLRLVHRDRLSDEELLYLELVSDIVFHQYSLPKTNFSPSIHEMYMDLGAFGTGVLYQDFDMGSRHVKFLSHPLSDCHIAENSDGMVDTVGRCRRMTALQMRHRFGEDALPADVAKSLVAEPDREFEVLHMVFPKADADVYGMSGGKEFVSAWILLADQSIISIGGYDSFPYHVPRWTKLSGQTYGRSPAMTCLPSILMVNMMGKTIIKAAQKIVDPPIIVDNDGVILPLKTAPGSLMYKEPGANPPIPFETRGRVDIGVDLISMHQNFITKSFYVDWILREKKRERQTTTEIADDREEILRQMAPMLGRIQTEALGPMISRTLDLLARNNMLPIPPASLEGEEYEVSYISPAAMAQFGGKAIAIQRFVQDAAQLASVMPQVMDKLDPDRLVEEMALHRDVSRKVLRSQAAVDQMRQQREQQAQAQQQLAMGEQLSGALKNASVAQKNFEGM
jgi:hypothetical protein